MNTQEMNSEAVAILKTIQGLSYTQETLDAAKNLMEALQQKFPEETKIDTSFTDVGVSSEQAAMPLLQNYASVLTKTIEKDQGPEAAGYAARIYKLLGFIITKEEELFS